MSPDPDVAAGLAELSYRVGLLDDGLAGVGEAVDRVTHESDPEVPDDYRGELQQLTEALEAIRREVAEIGEALTIGNVPFGSRPSAAPGPAARPGTPRRRPAVPAGDAVRRPRSPTVGDIRARGVRAAREAGRRDQLALAGLAGATRVPGPRGSYVAGLAACCLVAIGAVVAVLLTFRR